MYFFGYLYTASELLQPYNLSIIAGATAYVVFMSQFLLSTRLRFLERRVPQDRLMYLHGATGIAATALVMTHGSLKFFLLVRLEGPTLQSSMSLFALLTSVVLTPLALLIFRGRRRRNKAGAAKSPPFEKNRIAHNLFALAGLIAVIYVMLASSTWSIGLKIFTLAWGTFTLGAYIWHKIIRPRKVHRLVLEKVEEASPNIHRLGFEGNFPRPSGQFAYIRFTSDPPGREEHPFTISSSAGEDLEITVRGVGDYTGILAGAPEGGEVSFDGPYGHFGPRKLPEGRPLIFLVGEIGITPVLSLARDASVRANHPITIIWSIATPADESVGRPLAELEAVGDLDLRILYTRNAPEGKAFGRLDIEALRPLTETQATANWFICGPPEFGMAMKQYLRRLKVPRRRTTEERFSW
jgi:predicted ferric reductase